MADYDAALDAAIIKAAKPDWEKTAVLISKVFENPCLKGVENPAQIIVTRIGVLFDNGRLDVKGNLRRWRDSSVRLVEKVG